MPQGDLHNILEVVLILLLIGVYFAQQNGQADHLKGDMKMFFFFFGYVPDHALLH